MNMRQNRISIRQTLLVIGSVMAVAAWGQSSEEYYINGVYNAVIADVQKVEERPATIDSVLPPKLVTYEMIEVRAEVPVKLDSIEAAKLNIEKGQQRLYKGYAKAGFGLHTTPLAELYFDQTRSRKNAFGIHYKHMSSNGGLNDVGDNGYSFNSLDGYYSAYLRKHEVGGRMVYDRRKVGYYGFERTDSLHSLHEGVEAPAKDRLEQVYSTLGFDLRLKSLYKDSSKLAHDVTLRARNLTNLTGSRELNVRMGAVLSMKQGSETYGGEIVVDNNAYRGVRSGEEDLRQNGTLVGVSPHVRTQGERYEVRVGAGIYVDAMGKTSFHFYPQAYAHYRLFDDILVPYVGVDGRRQRNGLYDLARANPWIVGDPTLANSSVLYDLYGGMRGNLGSGLGFDVRMGRSRTADHVLFVNTANVVDSIGYGDRFTPIYDRVDRFTISGELRYSYQERVDLYGRVELNSYTTRLEAEAWNLPPYRLAVGATYDFEDKLLLRFEAQFMGKRNTVERATTLHADGAVSHVDVQRELKGFMDLYLGLEYRYTRRFSIFLDASNLSATKYERWSRYPVQRGLLMLGATYAF